MFLNIVSCSLVQNLVCTLVVGIEMVINEIVYLHISSTSKGLTSNSIMWNNCFMFVSSSNLNRLYNKQHVNGCKQDILYILVPLFSTWAHQKNNFSNF